MEGDIYFPENLWFLVTESARYKVLYGGRGAGKTLNVARALIILSSAKPLRIACFREFQNSIAESVHQTLKEQVYALNKQDEFKITDTAITSLRTGSEFIFKGLKYNIDAIKSLASIDIAWIEEASKVSKTSWTKLAPTIRGRHESDQRGNLGPFKNGPEIWVTFNPEFDDDETYKRFVLKPPSEIDSKGNRYSIIRKINWSDNPFFPEDLKEEMEQCKINNPNEYLEIWEGHTKVVLEGAIYADEIRKAIFDKRIGKVRYDPNRPVHTFWDLGHSDKTAIWFIQTVGMEFNVINYYEDSLKKMPFYINKLQEFKYNYGVHHLPHDGDAETLSNVTPKKQLSGIGNSRVKIIQRPSRKFVGINAVRSVFELCNFDEENTSDGLQCLKRYCYKVDEDTGTFSKEPEHDTPYSHGADAFQTFALSLKSEKASQKKKPIEVSSIGIRNPTSTGWMA